MFKKLTNYIRESRIELKKVVWPSKKQTKNHTLLVIGISVAVALFLGAVDFLLNQILELVIY
ncbi:MAG TPA: preprotein translocase subunit SecE [Patescibacteria group bacterium]|nr:preprotein translocase subunit SecE [Patescibacteria group bacterium]